MIDPKVIESAEFIEKDCRGGISPEKLVMLKELANSSKTPAVEEMLERLWQVFMNMHSISVPQANRTMFEYCNMHITFKAMVKSTIMFGYLRAVRDCIREETPQKKCVNCGLVCSPECAKVYTVPETTGMPREYEGDACPVCGGNVEDYKLYRPMMEKRKLDYLLKKAAMTQEDLDKHFARVDERMARVQVGTVLYESATWDIFKKVVVSIKDVGQGIVTVNEPGYPGGNHVTDEFITWLLFPEEAHVEEEKPCKES